MESPTSTTTHAHVVSGRTLLAVWGCLVALTVATVAVAQVHLGQLNVVVALAIACVKATLVALYFMHLKYEGRFNRVVLLGSAFFLVFMIGFVVYDSRTYQPDVEQFQREHPATPAAPR